MSEQEAPKIEVSTDSSTRDRMRELLADRRALALIGVAVVAVLALVAFVVVPALTGSSSSPAAVKPAVHASGGASSATPTPTASASALPTAASLLQVRDPFSPLVSGSAVAAAGAGAGVTTGGTVGATSTPSATATSTVAGGNGGTNAASLKQLILVALTSEATARVAVNGLVYDVQLNAPFAGGFAMTAETDSNATFLYNGQTQTLVPGQYAFFS